MHLSAAFLSFIGVIQTYGGKPLLPGQVLHNFVLEGWWIQIACLDSKMIECFCTQVALMLLLKSYYPQNSFSSLPRGNHVPTLRLVTKAGITDQHRKAYLLWFNACTQKAIVALGRIDVLPTLSSDRTISLLFATFLTFSQMVINPNSLIPRAFDWKFWQLK